MFWCTPVVSRKYCNLLDNALFTHIYHLCFFSRPHALTKLVKSLSSTHTGKEACIVVCERKDVFASGCAVARVFSTYTRKTIAGPENPIASNGVKNVSLKYYSKIQIRNTNSKSSFPKIALFSTNPKTARLWCHWFKEEQFLAAFSLKVVDIVCIFFIEEGLKFVG